MTTAVRTISLMLMALSILVSAAEAKEFLLGVEMPLSGVLARAGKRNLEGITVGIPVVWPKARSTAEVEYPAVPW